MNGNTLRVSGLKCLNETMGLRLRERVVDTINTVSTRIEVDLSETESITGGGLGALVYLQKAYNNVSLLNPMPSVRQVLQLTRMNRIFDVVEDPSKKERRAAAKQAVG